jgi:hypothetical protein
MARHQLDVGLYYNVHPQKRLPMHALNLRAGDHEAASAGASAARSLSRSWVWVRTEVVPAVHGEQLVEHGGAAGVRDRGLLDSAPARPLNAYGEPDVAALAAACGFGIARNHPAAPRRA